MADNALFSRPVVITLGACITIALALAFWPQFHRVGEKVVIQPSTYSRSAIGYATLYEMLHRLDLPVSRSQLDAQGLGADGVLILAEPDLDVLSRDDYTVQSAPTTLLILPKQRGSVNINNERWVGRVWPLPDSEVKTLLNRFTSGAEIIRVPTPAKWTTSNLKTEPALGKTVQLIRWPAKGATPVIPIIAADNGILVGEIRNSRGRILVLSDPDPLENHGITKPGNATFALALLDWARKNNGRLAFDETIHGLKGARANRTAFNEPVHDLKDAGTSPLALLFRFPFSLLAAELSIAVILLLLATMARFGSQEKAQEAIGFGKTRLIENSAALLGQAGHQAATLRRYLQMVQRETAQALHAPAALDGTELSQWLDHIGQARGMTRKVADIMRHAADTDAGPVTSLFTAAQEIHSWSGEILNGPARRKTPG